MKQLFKLTISFLIISACNLNTKKGKSISFYHWKSNATHSKTTQQILEQANTKKIYLHYFDVDDMKEASWNDDGIFPKYVIQNIDEAYKNYEIIPVVYITNRVFLKKELDIEKLYTKIATLCNQISQNYFNTNFTKIQIDCDWTQSTQEAYFSLLDRLEDQYNVNATIRLHQIKYQDKTGVPPVSKGTLMLYNVGDLKDKTSNSILESKITAQYINTNTKYPLELDVALPLFSQSIIFNHENKVKISSYISQSNLENDIHFEKINDTHFKVKKDTLMNGFYLNQGFELKLEQSKEDEILTSYEIIKSSKLQTNDIIFYHLDEESLKQINFEKIMTAL